MSNFDHGLLNLPLAKRGITDAQLDRHKRKQVAIREQQAKDARKAYIAALAEAEGLIEKVSDERMSELGQPFGMTARSCRKKWHAIASLAPETVTRVMRRELA